MQTGSGYGEGVSCPLALRTRIPGVHRQKKREASVEEGTQFTLRVCLFCFGAGGQTQSPVLRASALLLSHIPPLPWPFCFSGILTELNDALSCGEGSPSFLSC